MTGGRVDGSKNLSKFPETGADVGDSQILSVIARRVALTAGGARCPAERIGDEAWLHVLGILKRVESKVQVDGRTIRYHTTQVLLFKDAVDLDAQMPEEIDVVGVVEGLMLTSMTWRCTACGAVKKWHLGEEALMWLKVMGKK